MPARSLSIGSMMTMSEPGATRCQAVVTAKGKPGQCNQPASLDRGGHAVCLKHDRAVWLTYADADSVTAS